MFEEYDDILTVENLQKALHIGRNTAYALLSEKEIKSIRIGNQYRIPKQYLLDYVYNTALAA